MHAIGTISMWQEYQGENSVFVLMILVSNITANIDANIRCKPLAKNKIYHRLELKELLWTRC